MWSLSLKSLVPWHRRLEARVLFGVALVVLLSLLAVLLSAQRARQLLKGAKPTVEHSKNKAAVLSLREIAAGNVYADRDLVDVVAEQAAKATKANS